MLDAAYLLIVLMSFSGKHDDIARLPVFDTVADRFLSLRKLYLFAFRFVDSRLDVRDYRKRILVSRVVGRYHA